MIKFLIFLIAAVFVIRIIARVVLPLFNMTRMAHERIDRIKKQMNNMQKQNENKRKPRIEGDYVDYEEIK